MSKGKFTIVDYPGAAYAFGYGIGPAGQVVGIYGAPPDYAVHSYMYWNGSFTVLPDYPNAASTGFTIMTSHSIAGYTSDISSDGRFHCLVQQHGAYVLWDGPGWTECIISGMNPQGEMVGGYSLTDWSQTNEERGFLYTKDQYITIQFPEWITSYANGIDPEGDIVGRYQDAQGVYHGFFLPQAYRPKK